VTRSAYGYAAGDPLDLADPSGLCTGHENGPGCIDGEPLPPGFATPEAFYAAAHQRDVEACAAGAQFRADYQNTLDGLQALQAAQAAVDEAQAAVDAAAQKVANNQWHQEVNFYNRYKNPIKTAVKVAKNGYYCVKGGAVLGAAGAAYGSEGGPYGALAGGAAGFAAGCGMGVLLKNVPLPALP
jgi:hypothetical protein